MTANAPKVLFAVIARGDLRISQSRWQGVLALYQRAIPALQEAGFTRSELARAIINREIPSSSFTNPRKDSKRSTSS